MDTARERRGARRLVDDRAPGGDRWPELVTDEVERKVEGRDRRDDSNRDTERHPDATRPDGASCHGHDLPGERARLDGAVSQRVLRPLDLHARKGDRLARLVADGRGEHVGALSKQHHRTFEHDRALMRGKRLAAKGFRGDADLGSDVVGVVHRHLAERSTIPGSGNLDHLARRRHGRILPHRR